MKRVLWIALIVLGAMSCKKEEEVTVTNEDTCWLLDSKETEWLGGTSYRYEFWLRKGNYPDYVKKTIVVSKAEYDSYGNWDQYCE